MLSYESAVAEVSVDAEGSVRIRASAGARLAPDSAAALGREIPRGVRLGVVEEEDRLALRPKGKGATPARGVPGIELRVARDRPLFQAVAFAGRSGKDSGSGFSPRLWAVEALEFSSDGSSRAALVTGIGAHYWGFGEKTGPLDKRGLCYRMRTRDFPVREGLDPLYAVIPFFMWTRPGWRAVPARAATAAGRRRRDSSWDPAVQSGAPVTSGCLLECFAPSHFDIARSFDDRVIIRTEGWGLDLTVFAGPTPKDVIRSYCARTGLPPMPPLWALGYHQSRWSYETEGEVLGVVEEFARRGIPLDVVHLDIDYMDGYRVFTFDPSRFPDPRRLTTKLAARGVRVVTIVDPGIKAEPGYEVFDEALRRGVLCRRDDGRLFTMWVWPRKAAFCDFGLEEARRFWGECHERLFSAGVAGIWNDMNEPAGWRFDVRLGKVILPLAPQDTSRMRQADPTAPEGPPVPHEKVRNIYGYQECRALVEHLERTRPEERHFVLTRSGYAGIQRYAAMWTGDIGSSWRHLALSIRMLLGLSLSGVGFCGADIGGFVGRPSAELYARWIQIGALYPFCRTHTQGIWGRQEPYSFGPEVEEIARRYIRLRMRLLPYLYSLFHEYHRSGTPPWRPLFVEFPDDEGSYGVEDQVMLGEHLMAAPVLSRGARNRRVYFPPGEWVAVGTDFYPLEGGGSRWRGPAVAEVDAPLEWMPLFQRVGGVVPVVWPAMCTDEIVKAAEEGPAQERALEFVASCPSLPRLVSEGDALERVQSRYYEDDFRSTAYRKGRHALFDVATSQRLEEDGSLVFTAAVTRASGRLEPRLGPIRWRIFPPEGHFPDVVLLDGSEADWSWDEAGAVLSVEGGDAVRPCSLQAVFRIRGTL